MYQIPVKNLTKIRRPRKRVKSILCDIGMQQCQDLIEVKRTVEIIFDMSIFGICAYFSPHFQQTYKDFDAGEASFNNTEWDNFTDGHVGRKRKKVVLFKSPLALFFFPSYTVFPVIHCLSKVKCHLLIVY